MEITVEAVSVERFFFLFSETENSLEKDNNVEAIMGHFDSACGA